MARNGSRGRTVAIGGVVAVVAALGLLASGVVPQGAQASPRATASTISTASTASTALPTADRAARRQPNIIFFLTDDMSSQLLRYMPNTRKLIFDRGARFTNFYSNVPLCCPSRASILTGKYAHNTGVNGNQYPAGFGGFHEGDEAHNTWAIALKRAGYQTSLMGKYLNEYPYVNSSPEHGVEPTYVPPGWSDWAVPLKGQFRGRNYDLNLNGRIVHKEGPRNYLGDYLNRRLLRKIRRNDDNSGLALFLSYFGPHKPGPASPKELNDEDLQRYVSGLRVPRTRDYNERHVGDKPAYIRRLPRLSRKVRRTLDQTFREQVVSVKSIDRYVGMVVRTLRRTHQLRNTYLVFTSDHGYHLGSHRLPKGKDAPYLTDVKIPFAIRGPGIEPGTRVRQVTSNIDIAPTFAQMAGTHLPWVVDGESLLPLARGRTPDDWRRYLYLMQGKVGPYADTVTATVEPGDSLEENTEELIPKWRAVVSRRYEYILHTRSGEEQVYDLRRDPRQLRNLIRARPDDPVTSSVRDEMDAALQRLMGCVGAEACRVR